MSIWISVSIFRGVDFFKQIAQEESKYSNFRNIKDVYIITCLTSKISAGVLLAILEKAEVIKGNPNLNTGTVSAGYQNFIICVEMFFASVALRYAFPYQIYGDFTVTGTGRTVTMQSISSSLKVKMSCDVRCMITSILYLLILLLIFSTLPSLWKRFICMETECMSSTHFCCWILLFQMYEFPPTGDHEPQGHYDRCHPQFPPTVPAVHPVQCRYLIPSSRWIVILRRSLGFFYSIRYPHMLNNFVFFLDNYIGIVFPWGYITANTWINQICITWK